MKALCNLKAIYNGQVVITPQHLSKALLHYLTDLKFICTLIVQLVLTSFRTDHVLLIHFDNHAQWKALDTCQLTQ